MFSTAEIAQAGRTTLKGVRIWHEAGLFGEVARDEHGARIFTKEHFHRAPIIAAAQMAGMGLQEIRNANDQEIWSEIDRAASFILHARSEIFADREFDL